MVDTADLKCEIVNEDFPQYDLSFKIIVIGDSGVGKSSLTTKECPFDFIGVFFYVKNDKKFTMKSLKKSPKCL